MYYGCGWQVRPAGASGRPNTWHTGLIGGTSTELMRRGEGVNWAVLFNTDRAPDGKILSTLIELKQDERSIAGYGAAAKGNTMLNYCGIRRDFLDYCVDLSPHKQGLFLPGTHIPIRSPDALHETRPDLVLILPWNLKDEIMNQLAFIRDWGGRFLVRTPELEIAP